MDMIDLFIGSEGTLGVITEITLRVLPRIPAVALALVCVPSEAKAVALVAALRRAAQQTWRDRDPRGLDLAAIENMDGRCLEILREDGVDRKHDVTVPDGTVMALLMQIELAPDTTSERAYGEIGAPSPGL
jgi:FAD/FMN-containing dehydrogenase